MVHKFRWLIIVVFLVWTFVAAVFASQIGPLTEEEEFLPSDHPIMVTNQILTDEFDGKSNKELFVYLFWGVKDLDKEGGSQWDSNFIGKAIMDDQFDLSQLEAQKSILELCKDLRQQDFVLNENVKCWLEVFEKWVKMTYKKEMPLEPKEFEQYLQQFRKVREGSQLESDRTLGFINDKLSYFEIKAQSIGKARLAYEQINPIFLKWQAFLDDYLSNAPEQLQSAVQTANRNWCWMETERAFLNSAITGIIAAICFAFIILLFATGNIILSILAIYSVFVVILSVMAIMVFQGWQLGVAESIAVVIMIGLAVDYVVHLAADYKHSIRSTRNLKI